MGLPSVNGQSFPRLGQFTKRELLFVGALFAAALAIRGSYLSQMAAYPDELTYAIRAVFILGNNWAVPPKFLLDQPPLFTYVLAAAMTITGGSLEALRWVSVVSGAGTTVVLYFLGRSMFSKLAGATAGIALAFNGFHVEYSRVIYIESFEIFLISLSVLFFWYTIRTHSVYTAAATGVFFGLAFDAKYIAAVIAIAFLMFLIIGRGKVKGVIRLRHIATFGIAAFLMFLPLGLYLITKHTDPFYYDLYQRFGLNPSFTATAIGSGGAAISSHLTSFVVQLTHVSSLNPLQVYPLYGVEYEAWFILFAVVSLYSLVSFFVRRRLQDTLLLLLFIGFFLFALFYPGKRSYFLLYPVIPYMVMLGDFVSSAYSRFTRTRFDGRVGRVIVVVSLLILTLSTTALALSAASTPNFYKPGFGDWDEIIPITNYILQNEGNNTVVATNLASAYFNANSVGATAQFVSVQAPVYYYTIPPAERFADTPIRTGFPVVWAITPTIIENLNPQFVVISTIHWEQTTSSFQQYVQSHYHQPLHTELIQFFVRNP